MKKLKKLKLNKEIISSLQEKQMKSFIGGEALASREAFSQGTCNAPCGTYSCPPDCLTPNLAETQPASCCRKTCN